MPFGKDSGGGFNAADLKIPGLFPADAGPCSVSPSDCDSFSAAELQRLLEASTFPEEPVTHPKNMILAWGIRA
jgi:hypothetical protein